MSITGATQTQLNQTSTAQQQQLQTEQESGSKWLCVNVFHGVRSIFGRKCNVLVNTIAFIAASTVALGSLALEPVNRLYILCTGKPLYQRKCSVISAEQVQKQIPLFEQLQNEKNEVASLNNMVANLEETAKTASATIQDKDERLSALEGKLQERIKREEKLHEFCAEKKITFDQLAENLKQLEENILPEMKAAKTQLDKIGEELKHKDKLIEEQGTELTRLNDELKTELAALNEAQNKLAGVEQELGLSTEHVHGLNEKLRKENKESMTLQGALRKTEAQLGHTVSQHKAEVEVHRAAMDGLRQSLDTKEGEVREMTAQLANQQRQLEFVGVQRYEAGQENSALKGERDALLQKLKVAEESNAQLEAGKRIMEEQAAKTNKDIENLFVTIDNKEAEISKLKEEMQGLEGWLRSSQMNNLGAQPDQCPA
ncbi:hypothetical protein [Endozoicomonas ascidiicola]|uniref:hypothetical protein n=1 Tax=Endozoicomonas ascidiicola TaxID=1698521 RepID=UPI000830F810|nr:hypothetical protein [Endozoicomonas ascidiicola]